MPKSFYFFAAILFFFTLHAFGQCRLINNSDLYELLLNEGNSPSFEFNIPEGVTVTSVKVTVANYGHGGGHYKSRIRSFSDLNSIRFDENGILEVLNTPITGPSIQDLQIESGLFDDCGMIGEFVKFDWKVSIEATGTDGTLINYSGSLSDNLAIPDHLGNVYNGTSYVQGSIDLIRSTWGEEIVAYPDLDRDGFGDANAEAVLICDEYCSDYATNNLDCDDSFPNINPDQAEIPYNSIDDDCDPNTLDDDLDKDGFIAVEDCDDTNPDINPEQAEIPYNGIDDDCDPNTLDDDLDKDG
ncbi:putative metal-binding motif-containing protein, partial [uncultured Cyclobacterium sp.]|uniref:putative metal-binding motif-containing protein n=1 Tax=uncultured Cyclobacterium sp. TaxID=453820 RepID=UPI0030EE3A30